MNNRVEPHALNRKDNKQKETSFSKKNNSECVNDNQTGCQCGFAKHARIQHKSTSNIDTNTHRYKLTWRQFDMVDTCPVLLHSHIEAIGIC